MGRSLRDGGEEGEMGFWKEENTPASNWGCLPKDGFLTWALRRRRTDRVCDCADECILEAAAISVAPVDGYPEQLAIFVVLKKGSSIEPGKLKILFSRTIIQSNLNPLFKGRIKDL
ncbi:putative acyl-activating enzyme 18 [Quercus suber]|uniref:Acyl-activating enzyme 18 n=1 Tax=Quercus suber TaxID=58331 RepID=A0AAW0JDP3_QUESU